MYGIKRKDSAGWIYICVEGYEHMRYLYYSMREAERKYRQQFGLVRKRINWI